MLTENVSSQIFISFKKYLQLQIASKCNFYRIQGFLNSLQNKFVKAVTNFVKVWGSI